MSNSGQMWPPVVADITDIEPRLAALEAAVFAAPPPPGLTWVSNGDDNGLFYYIGTNGKTEAWQNPISGPAARVGALSSALIDGTQNYAPDKSVDRAAGLFITADVANAFVRYDLGAARQMAIDKYTIKTRSDADAHHPRNWKLQGSNDGAAWTDLKVHTADLALNGAGSWAAWDVPENGSWRYLRLLQTGVNSSGVYQNFSIGEIEFYGSLVG